MGLQAEFAKTIVDEWYLNGVRAAVVCPGSRSTPLALAVRRSELEMRVVLDERVGGFMALGMAMASRRPVVILTTSGTAAVELHPAVVEAHESGVSLIVVTADRPPRLHDVGAPQTLDQSGLYGRHVLWSFDLGVPSERARSAWRSVASRSVAEAWRGPFGPGPVHLNAPFDEPLVEDAAEIPPPRGEGIPWHTVESHIALPTAACIQSLVRERYSRGVLIAGREACGSDPAAGAEKVMELSRRLGWPVLADPLSGLRRSELGRVVTAADGLLRSGVFSGDLAPEVVVRLGRPWASRVVEEWIAFSGAREIHVDPTWSWVDPSRVAQLVCICDPGELCGEVSNSLWEEEASAAPEAGADRTSWLELWSRAEEAAQGAIEFELNGLGPALTGPAAARVLFDRIPVGSTLFVSSSMPVRDLESFGRTRDGGYAVLSNRGVNGIDGVVSTALGVAVALAPARTFALVGDLAFLHDSGALGAAREESFVVVVVDDGGGGIFSFLPQASMLDPDEFDELFTTRQRTDPADLARAHGASVKVVESVPGLIDALSEAEHEGGVQVVIARVDPAHNRLAHSGLNDAIALKVGSALRGSSPSGEPGSGSELDPAPG